jgi:hypothetical protein
MINIAAKKIVIDLSKITTIKELHVALKKKLEFPDFYGANINALIDCLFGLRFPESQLMGFSLKEGESLILELLYPGVPSSEIVFELLRAVESVNDRYLNIGKTPAIFLLVNTHSWSAS